MFQENDPAWFIEELKKFNNGDADLDSSITAYKKKFAESLNVDEEELKELVDWLLFARFENPAIDEGYLLDLIAVQVDTQL